MASGTAPSRDAITSARIRLAIRHALLCAVLLIGSGAAVYTYVRHVLDGAFDSAHELAVRSVVETIDRGPKGLVVNEKELAKEFDELKVTLGVVAVRVVDATGNELADISVQGDTKQTPVRVRRHMIDDERGRGVVIVTRSSAELERDLSAFRRSLLLFVPLALIASLFAGWIMAGRSLAPVRQVIDQQRAFMAEASHELRTPLAVIRTHAEVALDGDADAESLRQSLHVVAGSASQLGGLVDDLMYLARSDVSGIEPQHVSVDIEELLEETVEAFGPMAASNGSRLVLGSIEDVRVTGDPSQLRRLVAILIDNALRHGDPGEVRVSVATDAKSAELLVEDGGPGIPRDLLPRVFDRFVRGDRKDAANREGHGLGLAIARSIVASHRGVLTLRANAHGGTTASAVLPGDPARVPVSSA